jgi:hydroxylamine reductase (hybrid-cluster protein)
MDVLIYLCKGISARNIAATKKGRGDERAGLFVVDALFSTLTNVNFDKTRFRDLITQAAEIRGALPRSDGREHDACNWEPSDNAAILAKAEEVRVLSTDNEDIRSLRELLIYGLKGVAAYYHLAGCDGCQKEREYYTGFAQSLPKNTVILTAGCAKYRYNNLDLGTIGGIPRLLDAGQCNDSYSLVVVAQTLAEASGVGINDLPISYNIGWYEQKAVLMLLALLHLGIKDITIGPRLPAFISPAVLEVLVKNFGIRKNTTVKDDLALMVPGS